MRVDPDARPVPPDPSKRFLMPDFWSRIRKARLVRVLVVYVAIAWVVLQVADVLEDTLELPSWVAAATLLLLVAGLLVVMATAWLTAHPPAPPEADGVVTRGERVVHGWVLPALTWPRAVMGGVAALGAMLLVAMLVVGPGGAGPDEARAEVAGVGLAVLPFSVSGPDSEQWREGMLDLLSTNLDGMAGLRTIDPATVLARMPAAGDADLATRLGVARDVGARYALVGSAVGLGGAVRLSAEVHDLETDRTVARASAEGARDSLLALVDALSVDVVRQVVHATGEGGSEGALHNAESITTSSLPALRAYLEGERLYREGDMTGATAAYERALREDSAFALAHWGHAWATGWEADVASQAVSDRAFAAVLEHAPRLPERTRRFVRAEALRRQGDRASIPLLEAAVARYPDDPEAWYMLGEARFHLGQLAVQEDGRVGLPEPVRNAPFLRAIALDPSTGPYYYHVVPSLIVLNDTLAADSLMAQYERVTGGDERLEGWRIAREVMRPSVATQADSVRRLLDGASRSARLEVVIVTGWFVSYPRATEVAADAALRAGIEPGRVMGSIVVSLFEQGRFAALFERTRGLPPPLVAPIAVIARRYGAEVPDAMNALLQPDAGPELVFYAGLDAFTQGDATRLARAIEAADAGGAGRDSADVQAQTLRLHARALRALQRYAGGARGAAVDSLDQVLRDFAVVPDLGTTITRDVLSMVLIDLLVAAGRPEAALARVPIPDGVRPPPLSAFHMAQAWDALGQRDNAARHYAIFLEGWENADPGLSAVAEARAALARLAGER